MKIKASKEEWSEFTGGCKFCETGQGGYLGNCSHTNNPSGACAYVCCPLLSHSPEPNFLVPSEPGWYWMKFKDRDGLDRFSWQIKPVFFNSRNELCICVSSMMEISSSRDISVDTLKAEWCGPIPKPPIREETF